MAAQFTTTAGFRRATTDFTWSSSVKSMCTHSTPSLRHSLKAQRGTRETSVTHEQRVHPRHTALTETQTCRRCGTVQVSRVARCVQPMVLRVQSQPRHRCCWFSMRLDPVPATVRFGGGAGRTGPRIQMHLQQARLAHPYFCKVAGLPEQHSTQKYALPASRRNMAIAVISPGAPPDGIMIHDLGGPGALELTRTANTWERQWLHLGA